MMDSTSRSDTVELVSHNTLSHRCATNKYFQVIGSIHDIESYSALDNTSSLNEHLFTPHWVHLSIIPSWLSSILFHLAWHRTYTLWVNNPLASLQISHDIWDPHLYTLLLTVITPTHTPINSRIVLSYCGAYNTTYTLGFNTLTQIYSITLILDLLPVITLILTPSHHTITSPLPDLHPTLPHYPLTITIITHHLASPPLHTPSNTLILLSLTQLLWSTHLTNTITGVNTSHYISYAGVNTLATTHRVCYHQRALTFVGGLKSNTPSITLSDISHHHSSLPILSPTYTLVWSYLLTPITGVNTPLWSYWSYWSYHVTPSHHHHPHSSIALSPSPLTHNTTPNITSQHPHSLPSPSTPSHDPTTSSTTYLHHSWIASITTLASSLHLTIYLTRDYTHLYTPPTPLTIILTDKSSVLSSITYTLTYLGCHTLSIYTHNDTCISPPHHYITIHLDPILSQLIQESLGKHLSNTSNTPLHLSSSNKSLSSLISTINPGDLYTHHSIAVGLHITTPILLKGCLDPKLTYHHPDKTQQHYAFSCDGPSRGGTCDVSSWDSFYLPSFWILNTLAWTTFYFHWKHLTLLTSSPSLFDESSTYLNGWFRDYLWSNSSPLIQGYNTHGANDLSTWSWIFLGAHLSFATSFMFLIS